MTFGTILGMPDGHRSIIFDKSAFESLSRREHAERLFRYVENLTPVLLREILADLTKSDPGLALAPAKGVQLLARKFIGSGGVVNAECRKLIAASLVGRDFDADGRPLLDDYTLHREPDGSLAMLVDLTESNRSILRWARGEFTERDRRAALGHRAQIEAMGVDRLRGCLRRHHVLIPRPRDIRDIARVADVMLQNGALQRPLIDWLMEQCIFPERMRREVFIRWEMERRPGLAEFAAYAHHCTRVLLLLLIGMTHRKLSDRPTNRIDVEYLFYSPFCEVFVSSDRLHQQLAPLVLWPGQRFVLTRDFKAEMQGFIAARQATLPDDGTPSSTP